MKAIAKRVTEFLEEKSNELASNFWSYTISRLEEWEELDRAIESPVEQLFYIEWLFREFCNDYEDIPFFLEPQYKDKSTDKYRIDFVVDFIQGAYLAGQGIEWDKIVIQVEPPKLGIEIDGHIWHEKTKEQVQYHKERERFLVANGWKLLRFTGSEIFKDPAKYVNEVFEVAYKLGAKYLKELEKKLKERKNNG